MATTLKTISSALNLIDSKKQNLKIAFENLQSQSSLPLSWLQLDSHFTSLQHSLNNRFQFLQSLEEQSHSQSKTLISNPNHENSKEANFSTNPNDPLSHGNELRVLCEKMDDIGLKNYVSENFKDKIRVQVELREALQFSPDAGMMVLQSLEGFYGVNGSFNHKGLREMGRICILLLRVLSVAGVNVSGKAREKALKVAIGWKVRLMSDNGNILGALGFLYLVYAFGIVNEFKMDELVEFATTAAVNGEFMQLCRDIGLTDKVPEIVQKLIDRGKHVLAVKYVFEFNLAHKIPPVPILKAYVDESKKLARRLSQEGKSRMEITDREMRALKSVIEIIENHELESEYPRVSLEQRIKQLKGPDANMKHITPASVLTQHRLQLRKRKRSKMKKKQQQNVIKLTQTSTSVGPARSPVNPSSLFQVHPNPYTSSPTNPSGMVASTQTMSSYTCPSSRPFGLACMSTSLGENSSVCGSHLNSSEPHVSSATS